MILWRALIRGFDPDHEGPPFGVEQLFVGNFDSTSSSLGASSLRIVLSLELFRDIIHHLLAAYLEVT